MLSLQKLGIMGKFRNRRRKIIRTTFILAITTFIFFILLFLSIFDVSCNIDNGCMKQEEDPIAMELQMSTLLNEYERSQLHNTGFACNSNYRTEVCITSRPVRIDTRSLNIYTSPTPDTTNNLHVKEDMIKIMKPYPRKLDPSGMNSVKPVQIIQGTTNQIELPVCDHTHPVPVLLFSTGSYSGNTFHAISELLIPLFLTSTHFRSQVQFLITDYKPAWVKKHERILNQLSAFEFIKADNTTNNSTGHVHCFPGGVFGLHFHGILAINPTRVPKGYNFDDFKQLLFKSFDLKVHKLISKPTKPVVVLVQRTIKRMWLNVDEIENMMIELGFEVHVVTPTDMANLETFSSLVNSCHVMVGVHGAGLSNEVYLPNGAVVIQVVPIGINSSAVKSFVRPTPRMNLNYLGYYITPQESSLFETYGVDDPVFVDPQSIYEKGYDIGRGIYYRMQNVRLNVTRFKDTLLRALDLLQPYPN